MSPQPMMAILIGALLVVHKLRGDQQYHRTLHLLREARVLRDLLRRRREFLDMADGEPARDQRVEGRADPAVMLEHAFGEPVRPALPLAGIAVDRPGLAAVS